MMSTYDFIQLLAVVAVLVYSGWLVARKNTKKRQEMHNDGHGTQQASGSELKHQPPVMPEPFLNTTSAVPQDEEEQALIEGGAIGSASFTDPEVVVDALEDQAKENPESTVQTAAASMKQGDKQHTEGESRRVPDLRTLIIASELLHPKYDEF